MAQGNSGSQLAETISLFWGSSVRATKRFFKNLPHRITGYIRRKIREYKNRPPRKEINKVYVLVGYTTKQQVDNKFNAERNMIIIRRGLLVLIFLLLMFISISRFLDAMNYGELSQIFGFDSVSEFTVNDPFEISSTQIQETATQNGV
ncbi:MAG: hypothetical protein K5745_02810 [Saccharofermentans sp.]|nr:hypothetical protein [Saccharofermentans sp.]